MDALRPLHCHDRSVDTEEFEVSQYPSSKRAMVVRKTAGHAGHHNKEAAAPRTAKQPARVWDEFWLYGAPCERCSDELQVLLSAIAVRYRQITQQCIG